MTGNGLRQFRDSGSTARADSFTQIPVIDFAPMLTDRHPDQARVVADIGDACINVGFFYLANHGVPATLRAKAFAAATRFFDQPIGVKADIHISKSTHVRGFTPILEENFDTANGKGDLKESFDMALEVPPDHPAVVGHGRYGPNIWPAGDDGFHTDILAYYDALLDLSMRLLRTFAHVLALPSDYFDALMHMPLASMRLLHYPPQPASAAAGQIGAGAHSDYECFTILAQDDVGGLQVLNAEVMARWTNDRFVSTLHRVINGGGQERYSIPFFFGPPYDTVIAPLSSCVDAGRPAAYSPVLAGEYLESRFAATYAHLA
jgi:isopenicillin N synthase-like dioxygenase